VFLRDSGLLHALLGIHAEKDLLAHPKCGASWEGYAIDEVLKAVEPDQAYYWATYQGAELDLLLLRDGERLGVEVKRADAPTLTSSMRIALGDLQLDRLVVLYPGPARYALSERVTVVPLAELATRCGDPFGRQGLVRRGRRRA
jgi:predicted AAA+ superfamily ATPase